MAKKRLTKREEDEKFDKLKSAQHEAGHLTVSHATGEATFAAWIQKTDTVDRRKELTWGGSSGGYFVKMSPLIAVAGITAEMVAFKLKVAPDAAMIEDLIITRALVPSDSDLKHFPPADQLQATIGEALALLKKHKAFFDWAVSMLVEGEIITDGMARDTFEKLNSQGT